MPRPPVPPPAHRLFIGLPLPLAIGTPLAAEVRRALAPPGDPPRGLRLLAARDLHLTLCFLGPVAGARIERLARALEEEVRDLARPALVVRGAGGFPSLAAPRVLWCGVEDAGRELAAVREGAWRAARSVGWQPPSAERVRPFQPHLTVARVRRDRTAGDGSFAEFGALDIEAPWRPRGVALIESRPDRPEDRYPVLRKAALAPPGGLSGSSPRAGPAS